MIRLKPLILVLINTGGIRFDLLKGNFTLNDQKTVSPFQNAFMVLKDVVYGDAKIVLDWLNTGRFGYVIQGDGCSCKETSYRRPLAIEQHGQHTFSLEAITPGYVTFDGMHLSAMWLTQTSALMATIPFIHPFLFTALPFTFNQVWFPGESATMTWWTWCSPILLLLESVLIPAVTDSRLLKY